ncbi:fumarylacetoacetase [Bacteroidota bacterium]
MIRANNPKLNSWLHVPKGHDFPIQNLPFGIIKPKGLEPRVATRIGDYAIDLQAMAELGYLDELGLTIDNIHALTKSRLNDFIALGREVVRLVRNRVSEVFDYNSHLLRTIDAHIALIVYPMKDVEMQMPVDIGDYTDFYSSKEHATNVGTMFRDPQNALLPNWKHIPVGYHGRSSSIIISDAAIHRPKGQVKLNNEDPPVLAPTKMLDFELEMAFIIGKSTELGERVKAGNAEEYIFGMVIFNDLSARDIQKWEYVPLGPFLSKSFGSVISPWIIHMDALEPFRASGPEKDTKVLPYLSTQGRKSFNINLEVFIQPENKDEFKVCHSNFRYLYWNMSQQLAHHTVNGCNINIGDVCASGTISGPDPGSYGSMLELTWNGERPLTLPDRSKRKFIQDNDTIIMKAYCENKQIRIGFGESIVKILPSK